MDIASKTLSTALILFDAFMGFKQGSAMLAGKKEMTARFAQWNIGKNGLIVLGAFTLLSTLLILFPKIFVWGNFMMATGILFIIALQLSDKDLHSVMIEFPFFSLSLVIIYLPHPLAQGEVSPKKINYGHRKNNQSYCQSGD